MTKLSELKQTKNLGELAMLLGYKPKSLSYVLYKLPYQYKTYPIPKKHGGQRTINAPHPFLSDLQKRLARMLYECAEERKKDNPRFWFASHGFQKKRTIVSNANIHRSRRFVFNLDLEDFFGTINFGRVRGFFIKDTMFNLDPAVATVIAQIACYQNQLPQGSPCSPIISNLIGNILDSRMLALARDTQCTYTRYADDLTFSTNKKNFPPEIGVEVAKGQWDVGKKLHKEIAGTSFTINSSKTRMSLKNSRQTVTGLVVNKKVNIRKEYYLNARAMCNSLFQTGFYHKSYDITKTKINDLNHLEGTLSHIYFVKGRKDREDDINKKLEKKGEFYKPVGLKELYKKFIFYKYFVAPSIPLIITEGSTDIIYLKSAIRALFARLPLLVTKQNNKFGWQVSFLKPPKSIKEILGLKFVEGTGVQKNLIERYEGYLKNYKNNPTMKRLVIILCDNDQGAKDVFNVAQKLASERAGKIAGKKVSVKIDISTNKKFYRLSKNLYLVKIPNGQPPNQERAIEALFSNRLLNIKVSGKSFAGKNNLNLGKEAFAQEVVLKKAQNTDFIGFAVLLNRIQGAITDYKNNP